MELNSIKNIVLELLKTDERTRKDDLYLLSKVIEIATVNDVEHQAEIKRLCAFLEQYYSIIKVNPFSVLRTRQAIKKTHPDLIDEETVKKRNRHRKDVEQFLIKNFNENVG